MNQIIFWLVLLVVLVVIEIATLGLTTIWFAGGALVALIAAAFGAPVFSGRAFYCRIRFPAFLYQTSGSQVFQQ